MERCDSYGPGCQSKQVSAKELVQESIDRIEKLNPALNAVVSKQYEEALKEAEKEDYLGKPFAGVPFLLKDLGQNEKAPSSAGSRLLAGRPAGHTDTYVQRLKDLGFIIVGRTNTPEFGFKISQMPACMVLSIFPWTPVAMLVDQVAVHRKDWLQAWSLLRCIRWWWVYSYPSLLQWLDWTQNQSWSDSSWSQVFRGWQGHLSILP